VTPVIIAVWVLTSGIPADPQGYGAPVMVFETQEDCGKAMVLLEQQKPGHTFGCSKTDLRAYVTTAAHETAPPPLLAPQ
jgi:hypothetical protein